VKKQSVFSIEVVFEKFRRKWLRNTKLRKL